MTDCQQRHTTKCNLLTIPNPASPSLIRGMGSGQRDRAEHDRHDRRGAVHHHAAGVERHGRTAGDAGMGAGRAARSLRRFGLRGTKRGPAGIGRIVSLSARDLRSAEMGTPDFLPVHLAGIVQRAAIDRHWLHRPGRIRRVLLAGTRNRIRPPRGCPAHSVGGTAAGQLDRHARHRRRRR